MQSRDLLDARAAYFMAVVEEGSFSAAARKLMVSQPAVSQQVAQLESLAKAPLLDRSGYRPSPTEAGRKLYNALRVAEDALAPAASALPADGPAVTIGFTGTTQNQGLLNFTKAFRAAHPDIAISFRKASFDGCRDLLLKREIDCCFGIGATFSEVPNIATARLFECELCVICSHDNPLAACGSLTPADIANQPLVVLSPEYGRNFNRAFMEDLRADGVSRNVAKTVGSYEELVLDVSIGEGIAITSRECVDEREVAVLPYVCSNASSDYVVAWLGGDRAPSVETFIEAAKAFFAGESMV